MIIHDDETCSDAAYKTSNDAFKSLIDVTDQEKDSKFSGIFSFLVSELMLFNAHRKRRDIYRI